MKARDALGLLVLVGGGFVVYKLLNIVPKVGDTLTKTGEAIGGKLFDLLNPNAAGESLFYTVKFPDGSSHAVPSKAVSADWRFLDSGVMHKIKVDAAGRKFAVRI